MSEPLALPAAPADVVSALGAGAAQQAPVGEAPSPRAAYLSPEQTLYERLGVRSGASAQEIKSAYRARAREYHPDLNRGDALSEESFKLAGEAYAVLGSAEKRAAYDRSQQRSREVPAEPARQWTRRSEPNRYKTSSGSASGSRSAYTVDDFTNTGFSGFSSAAYGARASGSRRRARAGGVSVDDMVGDAFRSAFAGMGAQDAAAYDPRAVMDAVNAYRAALSQQARGVRVQAVYSNDITLAADATGALLGQYVHLGRVQTPHAANDAASAAPARGARDGAQVAAKLADVYGLAGVIAYRTSAIDFLGVAGAQSPSYLGGMQVREIGILGADGTYRTLGAELGHVNARGEYRAIGALAGPAYASANSPARTPAPATRAA